MNAQFIEQILITNLLAMHNINEQVFFFINRVGGKSDILDQLFLFITHIFVPAILIVILVWFFVVLPRSSTTLLEKFRWYRQGGIFLFIMSIVWVIIESIKTAVAFPRPQEFLQGVQVLSTFGSFDSFPSAHSALAFAMATFIYKYSKSAGKILFFIAFLVAVSRIFVGVHFPLDVIVGAVIGVVVTKALQRVFSRYGI